MEDDWSLLGEEKEKESPRKRRNTLTPEPQDSLRRTSIDVVGSRNIKQEVTTDSRNRSLSVSSPSSPTHIGNWINPNVNEGFLNQEKYKKMMAEGNLNFAKVIDRDDQWRGAKIVIDDPLKCRLKLKFLIRKGIPDDSKAKVWQAITGTSLYLKSQSIDKSELYKMKLKDVFGSRLPSKILKAPLFGGVLSLEETYLREDATIVAKRILCVLGMEFPELTFCPQIPDTVLLLLHFLSEEDTFFTVTMMVLESLKSQKYFQTSSADFTTYILTFGSFIKKCLPKIHSHIKKKLQLDPKVFCESWFRRLFLSELPFRTVMRIFDAFLNEGGRVLYRVALGILSMKAATLLKTNDKDSFINTIKQANSQIIDDDPLIKESFKISLHPNHVNKLNTKNKKISKADTTHVPRHVYYRPKISEPSRIIPEEMFEEIYEWIPMRYRIQDAILLFASRKDGTSFKTLYKRLDGYFPTLLLMESKQGNVFGAYITDPWRKTMPGTSIGTRECFLFSIKPQPKKYAWEPGCNDTFLVVQEKGFCIGMGGGGVGLLIDEDWRGGSTKCQTFNNDPLNGEESDRFEIIQVEVYAFT